MKILKKLNYWMIKDHPDSFEAKAKALLIVIVGSFVVVLLALIFKE